MLSLKTCLTNIANWIKGVDDYIVETGTEGIWTYEKYKNGIVKCYGLANNIATNGLTQSYQTYYASGLQVATVPTWITNVLSIDATLTHANTVAWLSHINYSNHNITCIVDREQPSNFTFSMFINLIGTWGGTTNLLKVLWRWSYA